MKKIFGVLLTLALTFSMSVNAFAKTENNNLTNSKPKDAIELKVGQTVKIPLKDVTPLTRGSVIPMGDAGYIEFTRRADYMEYVMHIKPFHTRVNCDAEVMDIRNGVSRGSSRVFMDSGIIPYTPYSGHQYSLTINGYAYVLDKPCVSIYAKVYWMN